MQHTGAHTQIMKQGYFVVDAVNTTPGGTEKGDAPESGTETVVVLIQIPDGHASDTEQAHGHGTE